MQSKKLQKIASLWAMVLCLGISLVFVLYPVNAYGEWDGHVPMKSSKLSRDTHLHFSGGYCSECHEQTPLKGEEPNLKFNGDFGELCWCHGYTSGTYIHPVDVVPSEEKLKHIPKEYPLTDGKITCNTCHDIYEQCQENSILKKISSEQKKYYKFDLMFLRGATLGNRTALCFKCHSEEKYKKLDPHNQLDAKGQIVVEKCLYCHEEKPNEKEAAFQDVKLVGNLKILCQRCHGLESRHPGNIDHYRKPSEETQYIMDKLETDYGIILPLDGEGKITCITCHNPHERGVIPAEKAGAKGADEVYRHRLPLKLCRSCHGM